jgi:hypothetical protein
MLLYIHAFPHITKQLLHSYMALPPISYIFLMYLLKEIFLTFCLERSVRNLESHETSNVYFKFIYLVEMNTKYARKNTLTLRRFICVYRKPAEKNAQKNIYHCLFGIHFMYVGNFLCTHQCIS